MQLLPAAIKPSPSRLECAGALLEALPGLMRFVRKQMRSRRAKGLSVPQFRTLIQLRRRPAVSLSTVSESLGSSAPTTSRIVSGLVAKGLVVRKISAQDRQQVSLQLTPRGQEVIDAAWTGTQKVLAQRFDGLSESQVTTVAKALGLLSGVLPASGCDHEQAG